MLIFPRQHKKKKIKRHTQKTHDIYRNGKYLQYATKERYKETIAKIQELQKGVRSIVLGTRMHTYCDTHAHNKFGKRFGGDDVPIAWSCMYTRVCVCVCV